MKAYFVKDIYEENGCAVIADTAKEAKKLSLGQLDSNFIDLRVRLLKDVNIDGLGKGLVDHMEGLKRNMFSYVTDIDCPICKTQYITIFKNEKDEIGCSMCLNAQ